jgi:hypothetical protein
MSDIEAKWICIRRQNGHFEALGPAIQAFDTEAEAVDARDALAKQNHGTIYAVFELSSQHTVKPVSVVERVNIGKGKK